MEQLNQVGWLSPNCHKTLNCGSLPSWIRISFFAVVKPVEPTQGELQIQSNFYQDEWNIMELHLAVRKVRVQEFKIRCLMQRSYFTQSYSTSQLCFASCYSIACGKPPSHREVAPRECAVHPRWKPQRSRREETQKRRRRRRQSRKTEAACIGSACRNNLLTVYPVE